MAACCGGMTEREAKRWRSLERQRIEIRGSEGEGKKESEIRRDEETESGRDSAKTKG